MWQSLDNCKIFDIYKKKKNHINVKTEEDSMFEKRGILKGDFLKMGIL